MSTIAIIPAKGQSKGLPGKNKRLMHGKPLFLWSVEQALEANLDRVYVSTDDQEIEELAQKVGAMSLWRPSKLCQDNTSIETVVDYHIGLNFIAQKDDIVVILQSTSPCRTSKDINLSIRMLHVGPRFHGYDSVLSVCPSHRFLWGSAKPINYDFCKRPDRREMRQYVENGSIYACLCTLPFQRLYGRIGLYLMDYWSQFEIDSQEDWDLVEFAMIKKGLVNGNR